jgi:hypothetical protein
VNPIKPNKSFQIKTSDEKSHLNLLDNVTGYIQRKKCPVIIILKERSDLGHYAE